MSDKGGSDLDIFFVYDAAGKPTWYVQSGCTWNADFTSCNGALYKPTSAPLKLAKMTLRNAKKHSPAERNWSAPTSRNPTNAFRITRCSSRMASSSV